MCRALNDFAPEYLTAVLSSVSQTITYALIYDSKDNLMFPRSKSELYKRVWKQGIPSPCI